MTAMTEQQTTTKRRAGKSATAFRTISEVSKQLDLPQHVLRFWESKFPQIKPMKRGGGRRYYRPEDLEVLRRIRGLLYDDGYTIKGVQKLLREIGASNLQDAIVSGSSTPSSQASQASQASEPDRSGRKEAMRDLLSELEEIRKML